MLSLLLYAALAQAQDPPALPPIPDEDTPEAAGPDDVAIGPPVPADTAEITTTAGDRSPPPAPPAEPAEPPRKGPSYELTLRSRYMSVPRGLLDLFMSNDQDAGWPLPGESRPPMLGYSIGLELAVVRNERSHLDVYIEYIGSLVREGYWDNRETPLETRNGNWLRPSPGFGGVAVAFNGFHHVPMVEPGQTGGAFQMSFYVGGGLGILGIVGRMDKWSLDTETNRPSYQQAKAGDDPLGPLALGSPIWPVVDFELGLHMLIEEHVVIRLGGGLHSALQVGAQIGARL